MSNPTPESIPTTLVVRVIAKDGKFLGDDIGGAAITIRDALTREILLQGNTTGDSGPNGTSDDQNAGLMCAKLKRGEPLPMDANTACFSSVLQLSEPRRIEVVAYGPLGARESAQTASLTTWVFPGKNMDEGNGIVLELSGLICQIIDPPAHTVLLQSTAVPVTVTANVAMMCGCPVSVKTKPASLICPCVDVQKQPWLPEDFEVRAMIASSVLKESIVFNLNFDYAGNVAGKFSNRVPGNSLQPASYLVTVYAQQKSTGNTGVGFSTWVVPKPAS